MSRLKIAAVSFLNARPITYGLERGLGEDRFELSFELPSRCAQLLAAGVPQQLVDQFGQYAELGFDEFVLDLTVQRGLSGERSYSFPPMMISWNLSGCPAMVVCMVNWDACWGLTTMIPSPVASNVTLPLTMCATRVK